MTTDVSSTVAACCSTLYGSPLAELLVGDSFHPGGLASTERLLRASRLLPGASLLDIGCGLGASTRLAAGMFGLCVEAVDPSAPIVDRARARGGDARIRWSVGALPSLAVPAGLFDGVLAECVLSPVDRAAAVPELGRIIRPGGVLLLSDVEDFSYEEIAAILDIPVGTVRSRLFRARNSLKEKLEGYAHSLGYKDKRQKPSKSKAKKTGGNK